MFRVYQQRQPAHFLPPPGAGECGQTHHPVPGRTPMASGTGYRHPGHAEGGETHSRSRISYLRRWQHEGRTGGTDPRSLGPEQTVRFFDPLPVSEIAEVMARADLGVVPKRADSFGNEAYSTKIMEFMSLGVPVVVSSTKIDRYYFNDSVVRFFESGNPARLPKPLLKSSRMTNRQRMIARALKYADQNSWKRRKNDYLELVDALIENRPVQPGKNKPGTLADGQNGWENRDADAEAEHLAVKLAF